MDFTAKTPAQFASASECIIQKESPSKFQLCLTFFEDVHAEGLNLSKDVDFSACTNCIESQEVCPRGAVEIVHAQIPVRGKEG